MPPKPSIPTPKDLDDAIQATNDNLHSAIQATHQHMDDRFQAADANLEAKLHQMQTRMENQDHLQATRHESLKSYLADLLTQHHQPTVSSNTAAPSSALTSTSQSRPQPTTVSSTNIPSPFSLQYLSSPAQSPLSTNTPLTSLSTPIFTSSHMPIFTQTTRLHTHSPNTQLHQQPYPTYTEFPQHSYNQIYQQQQQTRPFPIFPSQFSPFSSHNPSPPSFRTPKLELSMFDGTDPLEWLFQAEQFFTFYQIPVESRLPMSSFYMKGDALCWFKWMYQNRQLFDWTTFTRALELRFGPSTYANHQAELFKLRQSGSVSEYQAQFEKLGNRVVGLPAEALLNCFISGLIPDIRNEMAIQRPSSIAQAIGLAKLIEAKIKDSKPRFSKPFTPPPPPILHDPQLRLSPILPHPNPHKTLHLPLIHPNHKQQIPLNYLSNVSPKPNYKNAEPLAFVITVTRSSFPVTNAPPTNSYYSLLMRMMILRKYPRKPN
ncbi:putative succinate dehydrogenase (quinone) [Medicago truncatula]|uniref:Putative succinate dehydrogenase (Quinone) n=1 Tax=Medicago truncatula TaxID=3880 RepID=A0A396HEK7_MEDTR|nr:putative succinate dehydrogenase (quinone) [Medicago truncatula]